MISRHPKNLVQLLRNDRAHREQAAILDPPAIVIPGANQGTPSNTPDSFLAKALEVRTADPVGSDLYEGRVWWRTTATNLIKFFTGTVTRVIVMTAQASGILLALTELDWGTRTEKGDALVTGVGPGFAPAWTAQYATIEIILDAGGTVLTAGIKMDLAIDFDCDVISWTAFTDLAATARVDLWSDSYANYPPTIADTMPNSNATKPQVAAAVKGSGSASTWTKKTIAAGDIIRVNLDNNDVATRFTVALKVRRT